MRRGSKGCETCNCRQHKILVLLTKIIAPPFDPMQRPRERQQNQLDGYGTRKTLWSFRSLFRHLTLTRSKLALNVFLGLLSRPKAPFQLGVFYRSQNFAEKRPWLVAHLEQILPGQ